VIGPSNPVDATQVFVAAPLLEAADELVELLELLLPQPATNAPAASAAMIVRDFTTCDLLLGDLLLS
jgi:hypothetical protein